jgi:hypothetical protein
LNAAPYDDAFDFTSLDDSRSSYEFVVSDVAKDEMDRIVVLASATLRIITAFSSALITRLDASKTAVAGMELFGGLSAVTTAGGSTLAREVGSILSARVTNDALDSTAAGCVDSTRFAVAVAAPTNVFFFETVVTTLCTPISKTIAAAAAYAGVAYSMEHANSAPDRNQDTTIRSMVRETAATVLKGL